MKRAVIVGCAGQDGRILHSRLNQRGDEVVGIPRTGPCTGAQNWRKPVDIRRPQDVADLVRALQPEEVYYLAAVHHASEERPPGDPELLRQSYEVHVLALVNFLEAIRTLSRKTRLFYAASSRIFGASPAPVQDETTPLNPTDIYGITKAGGVLACRLYRNQRSVFASSGILYNHESALRDPGFISRKIIRGALRIQRGQEEVLELGDLQAGADWGWAPDYIEAMVRILAHSSPDDFVVASGEKHTVLEFVQEVFGRLGLDWKSHVRENPRLLIEKTPTLVGNPRKLMRSTGWKPSLTFPEMVERLLEAEKVASGT